MTKLLKIIIFPIMIFIMLSCGDPAVYDEPFPPMMRDLRMRRAVVVSGLPINEDALYIYSRAVGLFNARILIDEFRPIKKLSKVDQYFVAKYIARKGNSLLYPPALDVPIPEIPVGITIGQVIKEQRAIMKR